MRVYLPVTLPVLAEVLRSGAIAPAPLRGFAVTPALREAYASGDDEELEYVAMTAAARASLRLIAAAPGTAPRRVVLAAEIPETLLHWRPDDSDAGVVEIIEPVPVAWIAAGHVDDPVAETDIASAADALDAADSGDDDASFVVDGAEAHELLWYASQELADL
jgi:hypothetical protein